MFNYSGNDPLLQRASALLAQDISEEAAQLRKRSGRQREEAKALCDRVKAEAERSRSICERSRRVNELADNAYAGLLMIATRASHVAAQCAARGDEAAIYASDTWR